MTHFPDWQGCGARNKHSAGESVNCKTTLENDFIFSGKFEDIYKPDSNFIPVYVFYECILEFYTRPHI